MSVVFILLDAFRNDYLNKNISPFLYTCSQIGYYVRNIIPSAGFCERTEIFTGKKPDESGFFTAIGYDPQKNLFIKYQYIFNLFHLLEQKLPAFVNKKIRGALNRVVNRYPLPKCYNIPLNIYPYFSLTEDYIANDNDNAFSGNSLFQLMRNKGIQYYFESFTSLKMTDNGNDDDRLKLALNNANNNEISFFAIYMSTLDSVGHKYGPESQEMRKSIFELDCKLKTFVDNFEKERHRTTFLFLGDHGMTTVKKVIDFNDIMINIGFEYKLELAKDYLYFIDSTLFRVWIFNVNVRQQIINRLNKISDEINCGKVITQNIANCYNIPISNRRYGDWIWWADPGVVISPDFFHSSEIPMGMHGYNPTNKDSQGMLINIGPEINSVRVNSIYLTDVFNILKTNLHLY